MSGLTPLPSGTGGLYPTPPHPTPDSVWEGMTDLDPPEPDLPEGLWESRGRAPMDPPQGDTDVTGSSAYYYHSYHYH